MVERTNIPYIARVLMLVGFRILVLLGSLNKFFFYPKSAHGVYKQKFKGFYEKFEEIYFNYVYRRVSDCSHAPVCSRPNSKIVLLDRVTKDYGWTFEFTGQQVECVNMGSFNYLGLVNLSTSQTEDIITAIDKFGIAACSPCGEIGKTTLHGQLEKLTSEFLGVEDALICGAGFATNALNLPAILSQKCLVFSDEKNHASLILGLRTSNATILKYVHNDFNDLENKIIECLRKNYKHNGKLFSKILIVTEGIYSMDGTILDLKRILEIKKKYKAYLFIDDAHGVGILGKHGKGIFDQCNIDPMEIDILMGTYSKAFAANGGYIAGNKKLVKYLRKNSSINYGSALPPGVIQQAINSIKTMIANQSEKGNLLTMKLRENTHYLRYHLKEMGLNICGDDDSQIVPWILGSVSATRELKKRGVAAAGVIYPATPLLLSRIRLNVSLAHSKEELDKVLREIEDIVLTYGLSYGA